MIRWLVTNPSNRARRYAPFLVWAVWFAFAWATLVVLLDLWGLAVEHWGTALAMLLGSYVAGSTPMGGGTVGFPVLVLVFGESATLGRQFSFAIQAVGMTSATIFILCSGRAMAVRVMLWAMGASAIVLPAASVWLVPLVSETMVKLAFACLWGAFGVLTLVKVREMGAWHGPGTRSARLDGAVGLGIGSAGALATALTGVGIDMVAYTALVLLYRADLRVAIATSVVLMTFNSLLGVLTTASIGAATGAGDGGAIGAFHPDLLGHWIAAAPVVLLGAPLGALMVQLIPRTPTMVFVALLCFVQLVWMVINAGVGLGGMLGVAGAMLVANAVFHLLYVTGRRLDAAGPGGGGWGRRVRT